MADLRLTKTEAALLAWFEAHAGVVATREDLMRDVWGFEALGSGRTVDVHIARLRGKTDARIITVRGYGYRYLAPERVEA